MSVGTLLLLLGTLWVVQLVLAWRQARRYMDRVRVLRRSGRVAIGLAGNRVKGRAYVALAVTPDDRVVAAEALRGVTVFADGRPVPALVGRTAAELAAGTAAGGVPARVGAAARAAAAVLHPELAPELASGRPERRTWRRGGATPKLEEVGT